MYGYEAFGRFNTLTRKFDTDKVTMDDPLFNLHELRLRLVTIHGTVTITSQGDNPITVGDVIRQTEPLFAARGQFVEYKRIWRPEGNRAADLHVNPVRE